MKEEKSNTDKLLEDVVEKILNEILMEDDGGGDYGTPSDTLGGIYNQAAGIGAYGDSGTATASQTLQSLAGILPIGIVPRVGSTLLWGVENMTSRVFRILKTLYAYFTKAFFPGLSAVADYEKIRQDEASQLAKIDQKYAETLKQNLAVLYDLDAWGIVFLLDPSLGLGWRLIEKAPKAALAIANAITGGRASEVIQKTYDNMVNNKGMRASDFGQDFSSRSLFAQLGMTDLNLAEATNPDISKLVPLLKTAFNSKEFKQAVKSAGVANKIRSFAYNSILNRVKAVLSAQNLEDLSKQPELTNAIQQGLAIINQQAQNQKLSPQEIDQMKRGLLGQVKDNFKKLSIENLQKSAKKDPAISSSVSNIIKQIQSMK